MHQWTRIVSLPRFRLSRTVLLGTLLLGIFLLVPPLLGPVLSRSSPTEGACASTLLTPLAALRSGRIAEDHRVTVEGIVTAVFSGGDQLGGFFLQESGSPPVGLFVYAPQLHAEVHEAVAEAQPDQAHKRVQKRVQEHAPPRPGHRVQVEGRFARFHDRPQLGRITALRDCGAVGLPEPVLVRLPQDVGRLAQLQDVKVRLPQSLTVTDNAQLDRHGTLGLATEGRLMRATARRVPETAFRHQRAAHSLWLDDGSYRANPDPIPYLDRHGTRRAGDTISGLTGILTQAFGAYRLHPTRDPVFEAANPRAPAPPVTAGALRVATLNLENYFVTLGLRGAQSADALARQRQKLVAAVQGLDADILSLVELENHPTTLTDLVATLNDSAPAAQQYRAVQPLETGDNAIRNALLFRPTRVHLEGLDADPDPVHDRPALLGWFRGSTQGAAFGVVSVHFKAKSGCPQTGDIDRGQGCWNERRTEQAERLLEWIEAVRREDTPVIIAGDVNAYAGEDPIAAIKTAGKHDLTAPYRPESSRYTFVFRGEAGTLDYLLAGPGIAERTVAAGTWPINADEPSFLGFAGRSPSAGPWRSSDHDPVWADLYWP